MSTKASCVSMIFAECAMPAQRIEPLVGHADIADIGLDRAERIICRLRRGGLRQRVEEGGLADVGQAHDAAAETHDMSCPMCGATWRAVVGGGL